jgi:hypothetical protein
MGDSRIKEVSTLLSSFFNEDKLRRGEQFSKIFASWQSFVGPRLAAHSHIADVEKGLLIVEAEHPGWIQLLQIRQSSILEDVARRYPELGLKGIAFRLSSQASAATKNTEPMKERSEQEFEPGKDIEMDAVQAASFEDIVDPEFRALLKSLKKTMQNKA